MATQTYEVRIERSADGLHVRSVVRDFTLQLGAHRGHLDASGRSPRLGGMEAILKGKRLTPQG